MRRAESGRCRRACGLVAALALSTACAHDTTAPTPTLAIQCAAVPPGGAAPLSVAFTLDAQNAPCPLTFDISYGDGARSVDPDARHLYSAAGEYVASITLSSGNQTARCSVPISVSPPAPPPAGDNGWPNASFRTTPAAAGSTINGRAPLTVQFNMCRSSDPEDNPLYFRMDLDGDAAYEFFGPTGADCRHEAVYAAGTRTVTLCVTDFDCPADAPWCPDLPRYRIHPYQCQSYTVVATP
jgi:PKD repeat protein